MPRSSVSRKRSSSAFTTVRSCQLRSFRVPRPDLLDHDPRQRIRQAFDAPRLDDRASISRRSTYPRPSFDGVALRHEERHAAPVVAQPGGPSSPPATCRRRRRLLGDPVHDQPEAVRVEDRLDVLDEHRAALGPIPVSMFCSGAASARRPRRGRTHEHEVPELDVAAHGSQFSRGCSRSRTTPRS